MNFSQYEALAFLVKYGNLYQLRIKDWGVRTEETSDYWRAQDAENPEHKTGLVSTKMVEWLVENGLAKHADFDFMFARGKVVPTETAADQLKNHGMTRATDGVGVHLSHCCLRVHGCKYRNEFCPVITEMFPPDSEKCGACYESEQWRDEDLASYESEDLIQELELRGYRVSREDEP